MTPIPGPIPAVGVVCLKRDALGGDEVLLIRRGKPPREGEWSLPGGRIERGEPVRDAALRELIEETGVEARLVGLIDVVDGLFGPDFHYVLIDYLAEWVSGEPVAGDDAAEARFVPIGEIDALVSWSATREIIMQAVGMKDRFISG
ncbi:MAG: phosphohydrolase [Brevundimonas sp.]|nr:phosphohydrolase [Brevundimonas sp.]